MTAGSHATIRARGKGGGAYLWPSVEAVKRAHDEALRQRILARFGSEPSCRRTETAVIVDDERHTVHGEAAA